MEYYDYQDPNAAYGYDGYGYGGYENEPENQEPPPPPDAKWEDPMKTNREYVRKLQKKTSFVHEGFKVLGQVNLFLLEIQVDSFSLKKDIIDNEETADENVKFHLTQVQFWNLPFTEVNGIGETYGGENEHKKWSITKTPNYSHLFQKINTFSQRKEQQEEQSDENEVDEKSGSSKIGSGEESLVLPPKEEYQKQVEEETPNESEEGDECVVMKGVSLMFCMTGFKMIQTLQMSPIKIRVVQVESKTEKEEVPSEVGKVSFSEKTSSSKDSLLEANDGVYKESFISKEERVESTVAEASVTIPEILREAVLKGDFASYSGTFDLKDPEGEAAGKVKVMIDIKCYGEAVINCMSSWGYDNTTLMTCEPCKESQIVEEPFVPEVDNVLLRIFESKQKSAEMLRKCLDQSKKRKCGWFELARNCLPPCPVPDTTFMDDLEKQELERELAWRKLKQICRKLIDQQPRKNSLYDKLEEVRMPVESDDEIQTGIGLLDVNNPFEEEANLKKSVTTGSSSASKRRRSTKSSGKSSQKGASKRVSILSKGQKASK